MQERRSRCDSIVARGCDGDLAPFYGLGFGLSRPARPSFIQHIKEIEMRKLLLLTLVVAAVVPTIAAQPAPQARYDACVLGTAAVQLSNAVQEARATGEDFDETMFSPEDLITLAWAECEELNPTPDADRTPEHQDFVFTALMNMFFCPKL